LGSIGLHRNEVTGVLNWVESSEWGHTTILKEETTRKKNQKICRQGENKEKKKKEEGKIQVRL
jgi:hypothetical protein